MKKFIIIVGVCLSSIAFAQEKSFNLNLTAQEIQIISDALTEAPYKKVAPLMFKLQSQINAQFVETPKPEIKQEEKKGE